LIKYWGECESKDGAPKPPLVLLEQHPLRPSIKISRDFFNTATKPILKNVCDRFGDINVANNDIDSMINAIINYVGSNYKRDSKVWDVYMEEYEKFYSDKNLDQETLKKVCDFFKTNFEEERQRKDEEEKEREEREAKEQTDEEKKKQQQQKPKIKPKRVNLQNLNDINIMKQAIVEYIGDDVDKHREVWGYYQTEYEATHQQQAINDVGGDDEKKGDEKTEENKFEDVDFDINAAQTRQNVPPKS